MITIHEVTDQKEIKDDSSSPSPSLSKHDKDKKLNRSCIRDHNDDHQHPKHYFTKHYDVASGKFYHVIKATNERIWDTPKGQTVPMEYHVSQQQSNAQNANRCSQRKMIQKEERSYVIERKRHVHSEENVKKQMQQQQARRQDIHETWLHECQKGLLSQNRGRVKVDWRRFGYISDEIYNFEKNNDPVKLWDLSLNGNDLDSIHELCIRCPNLQRLSLARNRIQVLDDSIGKLSSLTHLNLLHNGLQSLPSSIGALTQLQVLDVSHNSLRSIPKTIVMLKQISVLNLECNSLEEIPDIGKMHCDTINLNSNRLITIPRCIGEMKKLKRLLLNDNRLKFLPVDMCYSNSLQTIHLSRNNIAEMPNAIGLLSSTLESLWLDNNKLCALPTSFYQLSRLKELRIEGNRGMVNPSMTVITKGPQEVLKWCELKFARCDYSRKRNIVLAVQDLLEQVGKLRLGGYDDFKEPHESVFESNVDHNGEQHYQFLMPVFWTSFIPRMEKYWSKATQTELKGNISSFPYERGEVEQTLFQFQDAAGSLLHYRKRARFRKCSCMDEDGNKKHCRGSKNFDWNCERPAILFRKRLILESIMVERRRKQNEEKRIIEAVDAAKKAATQYLKTNEGRDEVQSLAEERVKEKITYNGEKKTIATTDINLKSESAPSSKHMNTMDYMIECFPWRRKTEKDIKEEITIIENEFIAKEIQTRKDKATETNKKLKIVLDAWLGRTVEDIFCAWRAIIEEVKVQRNKDEIALQMEKQRCDAEEKEKVLMASKELQLWERKWDNFQDIPYWQHSLTHEMRWSEPTIDFVMKHSKWSFPPPKNSQHTLREANTVHGAYYRMDKETLIAAMNILKRKKDAIEKKKI